MAKEDKRAKGAKAGKEERQDIIGGSSIVAAIAPAEYIGSEGT